MERDAQVDELGGKAGLEHHVAVGRARPVIRIVVYNTRHCRGAFSPFVSEKRIARVIDDLRPDIAGLTEIYQTGKRDQPRLLSQATRLRSLFHGVRPVPGGEYGNLLLSPFELSRVMDVSLGGKRENRGCLIAEVRLPSGVITFAVTHLGLDASSRRAQIAEIARVLPDDRPVVLVGDFNGPARETYPLREVVEGFPHTPSTFPSFLPVLALDRVLFSRHFELRTASAQASLASDHRPMVVELEWTSLGA